MEDSGFSETLDGGTDKSDLSDSLEEDSEEKSENEEPEDDDAAVESWWENMAFGILTKLYLVLWKSFIIRKRHWFLTLVEFGFPILLVFSLLQNSKEKAKSKEILEDSTAVNFENVELPAFVSHRRYLDSGRRFYNESLAMKKSNNGRRQQSFINGNKDAFQDESRDGGGRYIVEHSKLSANIVSGFLVYAFVILYNTTEEKQNGMKELTKMMGLQPWLNSTGWLIFVMMLHVPTITVLTIIIVVIGGISNTDVFLLWLFLLLFLVSSTFFCFTISSCCPTATLATIMAVFAWTSLYGTLSGYIDKEYEELSIGVKFLLTLVPTTALHIGLNIIENFERGGEGLLFSNLATEAVAGDEMVFLYVMIMLLVDIPIYAFIAYYMESVMPGKYGAAKSPMFIFQFLPTNEQKDEEPPDDSGTKPSYRETVPDDTEVGIEILHLRKVFTKYGSDNFVAVHNLTTDFYKGEITVLLGHNGAGKTTTLNMITGFYSPSGGYARVNGHDVATHPQRVRQSMGYCPQENLQYKDFTAEQHLKFFAMMRGARRKKANKVTRYWLKKVQLYGARNKLSRKLSGGMRRRLSLAMALIAGSKLLVLDEPSSGLDPEIRRDIWDVLLMQRGRKTILITTHFMEEAEALADRIGIMAGGQLVCYGTPSFLKKLYKSGYHLIITRGPSVDVPHLSTAIENIVAGSLLKEETETRLGYILPIEQSGKFPDLFDFLETNKSTLGYKDLGVSVTTMEDIFIRIVEESQKETEHPSQERVSIVNVDDEGLRKATGTEYVLNCFGVLVLKQLRYVRCHILVYILPAVLFAFLTGFIFVMINKSLDIAKELSRKKTPVSLKEIDITSTWFGIFFVFLAVPVVTVYTSIFIMVAVHERVSNAKQLQLMTPLNHFVYWLSFFITDFTLYTLLIVIPAVLLLFIDDLGIFITEAGVLFVTLWLFGINMAPLAYVLSFTSSTPGVGSSVLLIGNLISACVAAIFNLYVFTNDGVLPFFEVLCPTATLGVALYRFVRLAMINQACEMIIGDNSKELCVVRKNLTLSVVRCCDNLCTPYNLCHETIDSFGMDKPGIGQEVISFVISTILYIVILALSDVGFFRILYEMFEEYSRTPEVKTKSLKLDEDVLKEKKRVRKQVAVLPRVSKKDVDDLLVSNLKKKFWNFTAVNGVSFGVRPGECFGLLGVNGAGKTTTFRMITGDEVPTEGESFVNGWSLGKNRRKYLSEVGYAPQFDCLIEGMTGNGMLDLMARLRGISGEDANNEVARWIDAMDMKEIAGYRCTNYSGGNKRKLVTAMALIGSPSVVFLDEPTSGVDPVGRRKIWSIIEKGKRQGQSIVLTSHSMDECEALCDRLVIMAKGQFKCCGNIQYLKNKFSCGFTIVIMLRKVSAEAEIKRVKVAMLDLFDHCVLQDEHLGLLHYHVSEPGALWSELFTEMEDLKNTFDAVEDYLLSQTTLEQVFLSFAKSQEEGRRTGRSVVVKSLVKKTTRRSLRL